MDNILLGIRLEWWSCICTLITGIIGALSTLFAVIYTNYKTSKKYNEDKEYQYKKEKLVILKPIIKHASIAMLKEELICNNIRDRVILLSSDNEGFDFYENKNQNDLYLLFSIKNESNNNNISFISLDIHSTLKTESEVFIEYNNLNNVMLLRCKEEIILRICSNEQLTKILEEINNNKPSLLSFDCEISYITEANEKIIYQYEIEIKNNPKIFSYNGNDYRLNYPKIKYLKDEFKIDSSTTVEKNFKASVFRNIQDDINLIDRVGYIHQKVGAAQAQGFINTLNTTSNLSTNRNTIISETIIDKETPEKSKIS